jgi:hypothetical protein
VVNGPLAVTVPASGATLWLAQALVFAVFDDANPSFNNH